MKSEIKERLKAARDEIRLLEEKRKWLTGKKMKDKRKMRMEKIEKGKRT